MGNTRQLKARINTARNISKITKAMEMVSASKMRKAQERALAARSYSLALTDSLHHLSTAVNPEFHPLLKANDAGLPLAVVIATDRGLCGSLNQNLFKKLVEWLKTHTGGQIVAVGKKAVSFCQFYGLQIYAEFTSLPDAVTTSDIVSLSQLITDGYIKSEFQSVTLFYMDFVNTLTQRSKEQLLLPLQYESAESADSLVSATMKSEYVFEPDPKSILSELLPLYIENLIYQSFLESRASEHSARMVTMKNASENAKELVSELLLVYNKSRQESITRELLEITTATLSLQS